ncbi:MAG: hypothetical protein ACJAU2_000210 [Maribacter sp.]|jgi:hypothetical protein
MNSISKLLLPLRFLIPNSSLAQTKKGAFYLGLDGAISIGRNSEKVTSDDFEEDRFKSFNFSISPAIGYFLIDNLVIGTNVQYSNFTVISFGNLFNRGNESENKSSRIVLRNFWKHQAVLELLGLKLVLVMPHLRLTFFNSAVVLV